MTPRLTAIVVDDEPLARKRAVRLLRRDPDLDVVGVYSSASEAAAGARATRPNIVLLDIRMPEQDGFELLRALHGEGLNPHVIIITAYSQRAHEAFDVGAIDYVLKPFDDDRFGRALERAKAAVGSHGGAAGTTQDPSMSLAASAANPNRLLISDRGKVVVLQTRDIEFIQAAGKYVTVHAAGKAFVLRQPLAAVEKRLDAKSFVRIHRSTIVNVDHIAEMHPLFHGDYEIILKRGAHLSLSRRFRGRLTTFLGG